MTQVRTQIVPTLERHGVDLVLAGHSHSYERSFLINGHYGTSDEFGDGSSFIVQPGNGRISGTGAYVKPDRSAGPEANRGTVYIVTGSAGGLGSGSLDHPAMVTSLKQLGSLAIDVEENRMDVRFLRETGAIDDEFTLLHGAPTNTPPSVSVALDVAGAQGVVNRTVTAVAADTDGSVSEVAFFINGQQVGVDQTAPYQADISAAVTGSYQVYAVARDDLGSSTMSLPTTIYINPPAPVIAGVAAPASAVLSWTRSSKLERKYRIDRAVDSGPFEHIGTVWADQFTSYLDPSLEPNRSYRYRVRSVLTSGDELMSNEVTVSPPPGAPEVIVSAGARWKYLDNGSDQGIAWRGTTFDDSAWASGVSQLGYGDSGAGVNFEEETVLSYGPDAKNKYLTYYFRKWFYVSDAAAYAAQGVKLGERINRDDGAVVYLNGAEIARHNLPSGSVTYQTRATTAVEDAWVTRNNITSNLVNGWNLVAAEVHQSDAASSDVSFDLELRKATPEVCDGYDNDIDGSIDEGFPNGATCTVGSGECLQTGMGVCSSDGGYVCSNLSDVFPSDRTDPVIQSVVATPSVITQNNHKFMPVAVAVQATDNCGAAPDCYILSVSSNEPCEDRGPGKLCPQWQLTGALALQLRAERNGNGADRVYTVNLACRDSRGNSTREFTTVTVPH